MSDFLQVTSFDPLIISGRTITGASVNGSNHLIFTCSDGTTLDAGVLPGAGAGAVSSVNGLTGAVVLAASDVGAQPSDADLTAIAALATTAFGRALLTTVDAAGLRTTAGLGDVATHSASEFQPVDSDLTAIAALATTAFGRSVLTQADATALRTLAGLGTAATANKVAAGSAGVLDATDPTTTNARTPTAHASTHASAGSDPLTLAESQITNLVQDLANRVLNDGPAYLPTISHRWDPLVSMYNWTASNLHAIRAKMKKLANGDASMNVVFIGDSTLVGYNGTSYNSDRAIPRQFGLALSYMLGGVSYTDGIRQAMAASGVANDRWTLTAGFSTGVASGVNNLFCSGAGTAKWSSIDRGTSLEFYYSDASTTGFTYSVDGAAAVTVTTTGTATMKKVTVTGLQDKPHNVLITSAGAGSSTYLYGARVWNPNLVQLQIHNMAIGGSRANSGVAGQNWSDTTSTGLQTSTTSMLGASVANIVPDLVVVCVGNNDCFQNVANATTQAGLQNIRNIWPSTPFIYMHPPMVPGTNATNFDDLSQRFFSFSDSNNLPYFSWDDWDNRSASYIADGLAGSDGIHPLDSEAISVARHLATMLAGPETYSTPMTSNAIIADVATSGTTEQIIYQIPIPSWFWKAGATIKIIAGGVITGTSPTLLANVRIGAAGTTADTSAAATTATAAITSGAGWRLEADLTCRTVGATGTVMGRLMLMADGLSPKVSNGTAAITVDTTHTGYLTLTVTPGGTTPVVTAKNVYLDVPPAP